MRKLNFYLDYDDNYELLLFYVKINPFTLFAHARNLHVALYGHIKLKFHDAEAIIIALLVLNFSHFNIYIFVLKNIIYPYIYKILISPIWRYFQI